MTEMVTFSVTFNKFRKCISVCDVADISNIVPDKFKDCPKFPEKIRFKFEEEGDNELLI